MVADEAPHTVRITPALDAKQEQNGLEGGETKASRELAEQRGGGEARRQRRLQRKLIPIPTRFNSMSSGRSAKQSRK